MENQESPKTAGFQKPIRTVVIQRTLLGFPLGIAIGTVIAIIVSLTLADGLYYPVTPGLLEKTSSELAAVILQTVICGLFGALWSGTSVIFQIDSWSLTRQTLTHLAIAMPSTLIVALVSAWVPMSVVAVLAYMGTWVLVYAVIWMAVSFYWHSQVRKLNSRL